MATFRATRLYARCWSCLRKYTKSTTLETRNSCRSLCSKVVQSTEDTHITESNVAEELPTKKKEFRKYMSRIYRQNRLNPDLEQQARQGNLHINLDEVHKVWLAREGPRHIHKLAKHCEIFEHVFGGIEFTPTTMINIEYGQDKNQVHWGNVITPSQASSSPNVNNYESSSSLYYSLILTNPDGNIWEEDAEILHWFVANIPGSDVCKGDEIREYLPPIPSKGTGFHRYVYCLLQQKDRLNLDQIKSKSTSFSSERTFKMIDLLTNFKDCFTPVGLNFFQAAWDETVTKTYNNILGMSEPIYDAKPFVTPTKQRKHTTRDTFDSKYKNM